MGLKENVIIGKLIPAGTGMKIYRNIGIDYGANTEFMETFNVKEAEKQAAREAFQYPEGEDDDDDDFDEEELQNERLSEQAYGDELAGVETDE